MDILTAIGVLISLVGFFWIARSAAEGTLAELLENDFDVDNDFEIISRPTRPQRTKRKRSTVSQPISVADFRAEKREGKICWRTGLNRNSCTCETCEK